MYSELVVVQLTRLQPKTAFTVCGGSGGVDGGAGLYNSCFPGRSYSDRFTRLVRLLIPVFTALALMASTAAAPNVKIRPLSMFELLGMKSVVRFRNF